MLMRTRRGSTSRTTHARNECSVDDMEGDEGKKRKSDRTDGGEGVQNGEKKRRRPNRAKHISSNKPSTNEVSEPDNSSEAERDVSKKKEVVDSGAEAESRDKADRPKERRKPKRLKDLSALSGLSTDDTGSSIEVFASLFKEEKHSKSKATKREAAGDSLSSATSSLHAAQTLAHRKPPRSKLSSNNKSFAAPLSPKRTNSVSSRSHSRTKSPTSAKGGPIDLDADSTTEVEDEIESDFSDAKSKSAKLGSKRRPLELFAGEGVKDVSLSDVKKKRRGKKKESSTASSDSDEPPKRASKRPPSTQESVDSYGFDGDLVDIE
ncbi:hypothetical protein BT69DRAFT_348062 [Atractiella rhizophila]|nr:hypothetical protein BT69DRAFT_348062 [Atractiella rhizophila]